MIGNGLEVVVFKRALRRAHGKAHARKINSGLPTRPGDVCNLTRRGVFSKVRRARELHFMFMYWPLDVRVDSRRQVKLTTQRGSRGDTWNNGRMAWPGGEKQRNSARSLATRQE
jgi:hypothetical protein